MANLSVLSYLNTQTEVDANALTKSTSSTDKNSNAFGEIFDNVNKSYSNSNEKNVAQYQNNPNAQSYAKNSQKSNSTDDAKNTSKRADYSESKKSKTDESNDKSSVKNDNNLSKNETKNINSSTEKLQSDRNTNSTVNNSQDKVENTKSVEETASTNATATNETEEEAKTTLQECLDEAKNDVADAVDKITNTITEKVSDILSEALGTEVKATTQEVEIAPETTEKAVETVQSSANETTSVDKFLNNLNKTDLTQNTDVNIDTKSLKDLSFVSKNSEEVSTKIQTQTEQLRFGLEQVEDATGDLKQADSAKPADTVELNNTAQKVQVAADVDIKSVKSQKLDAMQDALEKATMTQEMADDLNMTVTSVETSSQTSSNNMGNLLGNNAQDQVVKMSMENLTTTSMADTTKTNFAKTLDNVQQPKDISKSDILSQIHSNLNEMKENSGTTKVSIILNPENLGKINLELINGREGLTARMTTDNAQVKELLDKSLETLRNSLSSQGVNVNNVSVKVSEVEKSSDGSFMFDQNMQQNSQGDFSENSNGASNGNSFENGQNEFFTNEFTNGENEEEVSLGSTQSPIKDGRVDYKV